MAGLNPEIFVWARETAGLDREEAARRIELKAARGVPGEDRLAAIERGEVAPTAPLLRRMAAQYRRPLLTFYLPNVPSKAEFGEDFRTLPDRSDPSNVLLTALLRDVKARQGLVREILEDDEDATQVAIVGAAEGMGDPTTLAAVLADAIGFERTTYRSYARSEDTFDYLRGLVERRGIFVLLAGDCGHWSTAIDVAVFRGFAIADRLAPFIVVNDQDTKAAWPFTLLHEVAHLLLGETGVSGGAPDGRVERLCNDAAAIVLVDTTEIAELGARLKNDEGDLVALEYFADRARISRSMVAYQLLRAGFIAERRWTDLRDRFRAQWLEQREETRTKNRAKDGGPNWYVVRRHRLGPAILAVARRGMADGSLTPTRAARMLGVKPMNVYPLLAELRQMTA